MRITQEADYAVRIINCLSRSGKRMDARNISEKTGVTLRFTLKILRKLGLSKIVVSFKGVQGGYELMRDPSKINLCEVIESVDGPIKINRCLEADHPCSKTGEGANCYFHNIFAEVSKMVRDHLLAISFADVPPCHEKAIVKSKD